MNRGRPVSRDELITALWPQQPPADPSAALRTQLSRLRSALGSAALAGRDAVELQLPDSTWVDIEAAENAIQAAEAALAASDWKDAWAHGNVALNISSRPFLAGFDAPWVEEVRRELDELQSRARESIARAGIGLGGSELAGAERSARELVRNAPFRESGYVLLMRALVASGNTAEALRAYERLRNVLSDELGTAPGAEIQALHRRLLTGREGEVELLPRESDAAADAPVPPDREPSPAAADLPLPTWLVPTRRSPFVGRTGEISQLEDLWEEAASARRQIVLVSGEPGMGKTRLATEFAQGVHDSTGAGVLYGRADEHGTLTYQPFVEALRHWAINTSAEELKASLGPHAGVLARLVPEITIRLPEPPRIEEGDLARDVLFEAVTSTLSQIAASHPTLLVIDDLHWADQGSLLMFRQLARSPHRSMLMVLATHRETQPSDSLTEMLADLGRERLFERLRLGGLGPIETANLINAIQEGDWEPDLANTIHTETAGNPFLVEALVHHLAEHTEAIAELSASPREAIYAGGVPNLVREAVAHRAGELGPDVERVLEVASVVGREFESELLVEVSDLPADSVVAALESAVTAGLLIDVPGTLDRYAFSHSLFRQTVYSELPKARRTTLHRRLAEALERRHGSDPRHVAELARHFSGAGPQSAPKALEYCVHAGAAALGAFSYEEAIEHYSQALVAIEMAASGDEELRCEVLLALGEAEWRAGHGEQSRETFARASRIARSAGDASVLGRAALGFCADGWERFGVPDQDAQQMLSDALDAVPEDAALRAKLTGRLAQVVDTEQPERGEELGREAVAVARASGDQSALAVALIGQWYAMQRPDAHRERSQIVAELLEVCDALHDRDLSLQSQTLRARSAAEAGDIDELGAAITEHAKLADQIKQPGQQLHSRAYRATRALIRGRFEEVEELAAEVIELGMLAQSPAALHYSAVELIVLRWEQGRMDEVEQALREIYERTGAPMWRAALAVLAVDRGDIATAQAELAAMIDGADVDISFDGDWLAGMTFLALACVESRDAERAAVLYEALEPYRGRIAVAGAGAACIGPVSHFLGLLAWVAGDREGALELLEEAAGQSRAAGSEPWLARANMRLGMILAELGGDAEAARSEQLLGEARSTAERLGLGRLLRLADGSPTAKAAAKSRLGA